MCNVRFVVTSHGSDVDGVSYANGRSVISNIGNHEFKVHPFMVIVCSALSTT